MAIGSSLAGYSFLTLQRIGPIRFTLNGSDSFATAVQVSSVPEPGTFITLLVALAALGFAYLFKRLRERAPERIPVKKSRSWPTSRRACRWVGRLHR